MQDPHASPVPNSTIASADDDAPRRVLVVGGSGHVGRLVLPHLAARHALTVYDLAPPPDLPGVAYAPGDVQDFAALFAAITGHDALLYLAMAPGPPRGAEFAARVAARAAGFDVNVKGVYLALLAAHEAGIDRAVYTSSMSVYQSVEASTGESRYHIDEDVPTDARSPYGLTKRLGEEVCRNAAREWRMDVNALRLCLPIPDDDYRAQVKPGVPDIKTAASDVAAALLAALRFRGGGFQAFTISGDYEERLMRMTKARALLGWRPLARPGSFPRS